jgi:release factor H-coupled RctB family protein
MGERNFTVKLVLYENHSQQKITVLPDNTSYDALLGIASQKLKKKIKSVFTTENVLFHTILLQNQLLLYCSPKDPIAFSLHKAVNEKLKDSSDGTSEIEIISSSIPESLLRRAVVAKNVFADKSYIPSGAISQLEAVSSHYENVTHLYGMPDLHQGKRCPIGAVVITSQNTIHPDLIGEDIGCGMTFIKTDKLVAKTTQRQLESFSKKLYLEGSAMNDFDNNLDILMNDEVIWGNETIPSINPSFLSNRQISSSSSNNQSFFLSSENHQELLDYCQSSYDFLGTIGAGNHFAELQEIHEIFNEELAKQYNVDGNYYYLTVHSGSRGIGEKVLHFYQDKKITMKEYELYHQYCLNWSKRNRYFIAKRFLQQIGCRMDETISSEKEKAEITEEQEYLYGGSSSYSEEKEEEKQPVYCHCIVDLCHNFYESCSCCEKKAQIDSDLVEQGNEKKEEYIIHRKGAAPAYPEKQNLIIIPGSRGTKSYLVRATSQNSLANGYSVSHGAGRKLTRTTASEIMKDATPAEREKKLLSADSTIGMSNIIICEKKELYNEEAPFAYKDIEAVIDDLLSYGFIEVIASLKPVITYKMKIRNEI